MGVPRICYSVREAAEALGISEWLVREECRQNNIFSVKIGGRTVIPLWALEKLIGKPEPSEDEMEEDEHGTLSRKVDGES